MEYLQETVACTKEALQLSLDLHYSNLHKDLSLILARHIDQNLHFLKAENTTELQNISVWTICKCGFLLIIQVNLKYSDDCLHFYCYIHNVSMNCPAGHMHNRYRCLFKELQNKIIWKLQIQFSKDNKKYLHCSQLRLTELVQSTPPTPAIIYPTPSHVLNKGFNSKFYIGSQVWQETSEEGQKMHWPKCCEYNNKDEDNNPNGLNDKNYHHRNLDK